LHMLPSVRFPFSDSEQRFVSCPWHSLVGCSHARRMLT
jgi:hypothetical protein